MKAVDVLLAVVRRSWRKTISGLALRGYGAGDRDRTGDIQLGKLAFYR